MNAWKKSNNECMWALARDHAFIIPTNSKRVIEVHNLKADLDNENPINPKANHIDVL